MPPLHPTPHRGSGPKMEESARFRHPMSDELWRQTLAALRSELALMDRVEVGLLVRKIHDGIQWLDAPMARYCRLTCLDCEDPCCTGHEVFFNQSDLLYLAAFGEEVPAGQTRTRPSEPCRYLDQAGCRLPRILRPYVCVWFICDAQMRHFQEETAGFQRQFIRTLQDVRSSRLRLELAYELRWNR